MKRLLVLLLAICTLFFLACDEEDLPPTTDDFGDVGEADTEIPDEDAGTGEDAEVPGDDTGENEDADASGEECPMSEPSEYDYNRELLVQLVMVGGECVCPPSREPLHEGAICPASEKGCILWRDEATCLWTCGSGPDGKSPPSPFGPSSQATTLRKCWGITE